MSTRITRVRDPVRHIVSCPTRTGVVWLAPLGLGIGVLVPMAGIKALGDLHLQLPALVGLFLLAWAFYVSAAWLSLARSTRDTLPEIVVLLVVALAARAIALETPPTLSDDLFRYAWEGRLLAHGISPYAFAPSAPELAPLRDAVWPHVNNPTVPSPYPPLAQLGSLAAALLSPRSVWGCKVIATLFDVATIGLVCAFLRAEGLPMRRSLVYAWNPLVLVEFPMSGHNDAMMIALVMAALVAGRHSRIVGATLFGLAGLAKVTPMLAIPLVWRAWGPRAAVLAGCIFAAGYSLVVLAGGALGSLPTYLATFADNDSLHAIVREATAHVDPPLAPTAARLTTLLGIGGVVAALVWAPPWSGRSLWWHVYTALAGSLLFAATVHAWYVVWILPFLAIGLDARRSPPYFAPLPSLGWLLFSALVILPYLTYADHVWQLWISFAEYVPLYALLLAPIVGPALSVAVHLQRAKRDRRRGEDETSRVALKSAKDSITPIVPKIDELLAKGKS